MMTQTDTDRDIEIIWVVRTSCCAPPRTVTLDGYRATSTGTYTIAYTSYIHHIIYELVGANDFAPDAGIRIRLNVMQCYLGGIEFSAQQTFRLFVFEFRVVLVFWMRIPYAFSYAYPVCVFMSCPFRY